MKQSSSEFTNAQGQKIFRQSWLPDAEPSADVFIIHGLGEHSSRYAELAEMLARRGYAVHALDHPGHGRSEGLPAYIERFDIFVETAAQFLREVHNHNGKPCFVIGHSMGGVITCNLLIDHPELVQAAVLSGPALATDEALGPAQKVVLKAVAKVLPKLPAFQLDAKLICRDPKVVEEYLADPLVYSGKVRVRLLAEIVRAANRAMAEAAKIDIPMLFLHGEDDALASPEGSRKMYQSISSTDKDIVIYPGLYHEIFHEKSKRKIYEKLTDWLDAHNKGASPTVAER